MERQGRFRELQDGITIRDKVRYFDPGGIDLGDGAMFHLAGQMRGQGPVALFI